MNYSSAWFFTIALFLLVCLPVDSDNFSKHGLFWGGASTISAAIKSQATWEDVAGARLNFTLPASKMVVLSYYLNVEGIRDINGVPLPREGTTEYLQVRCKVDGVPYRMSSSMTSNYDVESKISSKLSSIFAANLTSGQHILTLQWKRTGTKMTKWVVASDIANPSYSFIAQADFENVAYLHELQDVYINSAESWKQMTKNLTFFVPRESTVTISFSAVVQPQLQSFIKDRSMEYITLRPVLDNVAYVDGAQTFGSNPWNPTSATIQGSLRLTVAGGNHTVAVQWRKMGNAFRGWVSSPSFMDGFTTSRNIIVSVDKFQSPALQSHNRSIIKSGDDNSWKNVGNDTLQLSLIKESAVVIRYALPITQHSNPNLDANIWAPLATLKARVVIDGVAYSQLGSTVAVESRTYRDSIGQLAVVLPAGMHAISLQWQTSPGVSWILLNGIAGGFSHGESLLTYISSEDAKPSITAPTMLTGTKDTVLVIPGVMVSDIDDELTPGMYVKVVMSVQHGTLHFPNTLLLANDMEFVHLENETRVIFIDTIQNINAAINDMEYYPNYLFYGTDSLHIMISDLGNVGYGEPKMDEMTINLDIEFVDYPFTLTSPEYLFLAVRDESSSIAIPIVLRDVDSIESKFQAQLSVTCGRLSLAITEVLQQQVSFLQGSYVNSSTLVFTSKFTVMAEVLKYVVYSAAGSCNGRLHPEVFRLHVTNVEVSTQSIVTHTLIDIERQRAPVSIRKITNPRWTLVGVTPFQPISDLTADTTTYTVSFGVQPHQTVLNSLTSFVPTSEASMSEIVFYNSPHISYKLSVQFGNLKASTIGSTYLVAGNDRTLLFETSLPIAQQYSEAYLVLDGDYIPLMSVNEDRTRWSCTLLAANTPTGSRSMAWAKLVFVGIDNLPLESNFMAFYIVDSVQIMYVTPTVLIQNARSVVSLAVSDSGLIEYCEFGEGNLVAVSKKSGDEIECQAPALPYNASASSNSYDLRLVYAGEYKATFEASPFHIAADPSVNSVVFTGDKVEGGWVIMITGTWNRSSINSVRWVSSTVVEIGLQTQLKFIDGQHALFFAAPLSDIEVRKVCTRVVNWTVALQLDHYTTDSMGISCAQPLLEKITLELLSKTVVSTVQLARIKMESITMYGKFSPIDLENAICKVDGVIDTPILLDNNAVSCRLPIQQNVTYFELLSGNNLVIYNNSIQRSAIPRIDSIYPRQILAKRTSTITVVFDQAIPIDVDTSMICNFRGIESIATLVDSRTAICESPYLSVGNVAFSFKYKSIQLSMSQEESWEQQLQVFDGPFVSHLQTAYGSTAGGDVISIIGGGFEFFQSDVFCRFGSVLSQAIVMSDDSIYCSTPPSSLAQTVKVTINTDTSVSYSRQLTFDYLQVPQVYSAVLEGSIYSNAASIVLQGVSFRQGLVAFCLLDEQVVVSASVLSSAHISCPFPESMFSVSNVSVLLGSSTDVRFKSNTISVLVAKGWNIDSIYPDTIFSGSKLPVIFRGSLLPEGVVSDDIQVVAGSQSCVECQVTSQTVLSCICTVGVSDDIVNWIVTIRGINANISDAIRTKIVASPIISQVTPKVSFLNGGEVAYFSGSGFSYLTSQTSVFCNFTQNHLSTATIFNDSVIGCMIPPASSVNNGTVGLVVNAGTRVASKVTFRYLRAPVLWSSDKSTVSMASQEVLTLRGSEFDTNLQYRCFFGEELHSDAKVLSSTSVACVTPVFAQDGEATIGLSVENSISIAGALPLQIVSSSFVRKISPVIVSTAGGDSVTVDGSFKKKSVYVCVFNSSSVSAVFIDVSTITCLTPVFAQSASVSFSLLEDGYEVLHLSSNSHTLQLQTPSWAEDLDSTLLSYDDSIVPVVFEINTLVIDSRGGSVVHITFEEQILEHWKFHCNFETNTSVLAVRSGIRRVSCISPEIKDRSSCGMSILLSPSTLVKSFTMSVLSENAVTSVQPATTLLGSSTNVAISGSGFTYGREIHCVFGNILLPSLVLSDSVVTCAPPPIAGVFKVGVSFDGTWFFPTSEVTIEVLDRPTFSSISPIVYPDVDEISFKISGDHFSSLSKLGVLQCVLDSSTATVASIVDAKNILCPYNHSIEVGEHAVTLKIEGEELLPTFLSMTVVARTTAFASIPSTLATNVTSAVIVIKGTNMFPSVDLKCYVGNFTAPSIFIDMETVSCLFAQPQWLPGQYEFGLVFDNSHKFVGDGLLNVIVASVVTSFSPKVGSIFGGDKVLIQGMHFSSQAKYTCEFGLDITDAILDSSTQLVCISPPHSDGFVSLRLYDGDSLMYPTLSDQEALFLYNPINRIVDVFPTNIFVHSLKNVSIIAEDDLVYDTYSCVINSTSVFTATKLSSREVTCLVEFWPTSGVAGLYLANGDGFKVTNELSLRFLDPILIHDTQEQVVAAAANSRVLLFGENLPAAMKFDCVFNSSRSSGVVVSATVLSCHVPSSMVAGESAFLHVEFGGLSAIMNPVLVRLIDQPVASALEKVKVTQLGEIEWEISGKSLESSFGMTTCIVDDIVVAAIVSDNGNIVKCQVPPEYRCPSVFAINVAEVEARFDESFRPPCPTLPTVSEVKPSIVVEGGEANFTITGLQLEKFDHLHCTIGGNVAVVNIQSESSGTCMLTVPSNSSRFLRIYAGNRVIYNHFLDVSLQEEVMYAIHPTTVIVKEEALISVSGHFSQSQFYLCAVDGIVTDSAILVDETLLQCFLPANYDVGVHSISIETPSAEVVGEVTFQIVEKPVISKVSLTNLESRLYVYVEVPLHLHDLLLSTSWYCDINSTLFPSSITMDDLSKSPVLSCDLTSFSMIICEDKAISVSIVSHDGLLQSIEVLTNVLSSCENSNMVAEQKMNLQPEPLFANDSSVFSYIMSLTNRMDQTLDIEVLKVTPSVARQVKERKIYPGWFGLGSNMDQQVELLLNSSKHFQSNVNDSISHDRNQDHFLLETYLEQQPLFISNVRPMVVDSVNGSWVDVFGQNFVSHTVCTVGNETEISTIYLSPSLLRCYIPPPSLFQKLSLVSLRVKNTLSAGRSTLSTTVWYDVAYKSAFTIQKDAESEESLLVEAIRSVEEHPRSGYVCLLKDGCNFVPSESVVENANTLGQDVTMKYRFASDSSSKNDSRSQKFNASSYQDSSSSARNSSVFFIQPDEISLPCDNCFLQVVGSFSKESHPLCLQIYSNETSPCYNSVYNEYSEAYCSLPPYLVPGMQNISILAKCSQPIYTKSIHFSVNSWSNKKWAVSKEENVERSRPVVISVYPSFGWAQFRSSFEIYGEHFDLVQTMVLVPKAGQENRIPVDYHLNQDRINFVTPDNLLAGDYKIVLISSFGESLEIPQMMKIYEQPNIFTASTSEESPSVVDLFGFGFSIYNQVLCRVTYSNSTTRMSEGRIYSDKLIQCNKESETLLGASYALSFNGIDFSKPVEFLDTPYLLYVKNRTEGAGDAELLENDRQNLKTLALQTLNESEALFVDPITLTLSCSRSNLVSIRLLNQAASLNSEYSCMLDDNFLSMSQYHSQKVAVCKLPPLRPATYSLQLYDSAGKLAAVATKVVCTPEPKVSSVVLSPMYDSVKTSFVIRGVYFSEFMSTRCYINNEYGEVSISNQNKMICTFSYLHAKVGDEVAQFGVSASDRSIFVTNVCITEDLLMEGAELTVGDEGSCKYSSVVTDGANEKGQQVGYNFSIRSIFPRSGLTSGKTVVRIGLLGISMTSQVQCLFDGIPVPAFVPEPESIVCRTPSHVPGNVTLSVVSRDDSVHWCCETFTYYPPMLIAFWEPTRLNGYVQSVVQLRLTNLMSNGPLYCHVNDLEVVSATIVNSTHVACRVPVLYSTSANISIGSFSESWSNVITLNVEHTDSLMAISPVFGSVLGGTTVVVTIPSSLDLEIPFCEFGSFGRVLGIIEDSLLYCISPPSSTMAVVDIYIVDGAGLNDPKFFAGVYKYLNPAALFRVDPLSYQVGLPIDLNLYGANFMDSSALVCLVNTFDLPAVWMSPSMITCQVPASLLMGNADNATVQVSNNGVDKSDTLFITARERFEIIGVHPLRGFTLGGNNVFISFRSSVVEETFVCLFDGLRTQAILITEAGVVCEAPMHKEGVVTVQVLTHSSKIVGSFTYTYVPSPQLKPSDGDFFISNVSSSAYFVGLNVPENTVGRFRKVDGQLVMDGSCYSVNSTTLFCDNVVTDMSSGYLVLELSVDGISYISNAASIQVFSSVTVVWTDPLSVLNNGMDDLRFAIQVENVLPPLFCEFSSTESGVVIRTPSKMMDEDSVMRCEVPPLNNQDENTFSVFQHTHRIFGPSFLTVLPGAVLDFIDRKTVFIGLHQVLKLQFAHPIYPYPSPAVEFQGSVYPIVMLDPFRGVVAVQSTRTNEEETLFLTYPTQSNRKFALLNISVVDYSHDLSLVSSSIVVQSAKNFTIKSANCAIQQDMICQVTEGAVETLIIDSCHLQCSLLIPYVSASKTILRLCRDADCQVPLLVNEISILPSMSVIQAVPAFGTVLGGAFIKVLGSGFVEDSSLQCVLGEQAVPAFVQSGQELHCYTPKSEPGKVSVHVQRQGVVVSQSVAEFMYYPVLELGTVDPRIISSEGGTVVSFSVHKYMNSSLLYYCRFNDVYVRLVVINETNGFCEAPTFRVDSVEFAISAGKYNDLVQPVILHVQRPIYPIFLDPTVLVAGIEGSINVYFESTIPDNIELECHLDGSLVSAIFHDDYVACQYDAIEDGLHTLSLFSNSVEFFTTTLESRLPYRILSIWPQHAFMDQSTSLQIELNGPQYLESIASCCFGSFKVPASSIGYNRWLCHSPTISQSNVSEPMMLPVGMAFGENFCDFSTLEITLIPRLEFLSSNISMGLIYGGDSILLPTQENVHLDVVYCRIGTQVSPGQFLHGQGIICITPPSPRGLYAVEVSVNGIDFQLSGTSFEFLLPGSSFYSRDSNESTTRIDASKIPVIYTLSMNSFPATSQFNVFVTGANYNYDSVCKLASGAILETVYFSPTMLQCFMPIRPAGKDQLIVENRDTGLSSLGEGVEFVTSPTVYSVTGSIVTPSFGPRNRQTIITVSVPGINGVTGYSCLIGEQWVPSFNITNNTLSCIVPANSFVGQVKIQVGNPDPVLLDGFGLFDYIDDPIAYDVQPKSATAGATLLIFGRGFTKFPSLSIIIGSTESNCSIIYDERLICEVPDIPANDYQIFLTTNGQHLIQTGLDYTQFEAVALDHLWPLNGPALKGQTILSIYGSNFPMTIDVYCLIDTAMVPATVLSTTLAQCRIPPHSPAIVKVSLLADSIPLHPRSKSLDFAYVPDVSVVRITPDFGYTAGSFPILVFGSNFLNTSSLGCMFADMKSRGIFLTNTSLVCLLPSTLGRPELADQKNITVEVTLNGYDYSDSKRGFAYSQPCDRGFFCPGLTRQLCPNGTYCPENSRNFTLCPPGTFQPMQGQTGCVLCAVGYLCPDQGLSRPLHCPNGLICDSMGLSATAKLCPAGSYCLNTTKSSTADDFLGLPGWILNTITGAVSFNETAFDYSYKSWPAPAVGSSRPQAPPESSCDGLVCLGGSGQVLAEAPFPCPIGHYCRAGAGTQIPIPKNFTSPQRCIDGFFCPRGSINPEGAGPCPNGYFCPTQLYSIICPAGTYCPGVGNTAPVECYPGTYNPFEGRANCTVCPAGYICPGWGLLLPEPCPGGFVCTSLGLSYPVVLCPAGYYCEEGTITLDPSDPTRLRPKVCKEGQFCLGGVASQINIEWINKQPWGSTHPQLCSEGTYCQAGAYLSSGSGLCFQGHYCPPNTSFPIATPLGNFASGLGSVAPTLCYPGTYAPLEAQVNCDSCPSGHTCTSYGTYIPAICEKGTYRSQVDSLTCVNCPVGTYSYETGAPDISLCLPCPQGAVCPIVKMTTFEQSATCPNGYICGAGTQLSNQFTHFTPAGYSTDYGTKPIDQYNEPCDAGFYCPRGTPLNQNEASKCTVGAFCPKSTPVSPAREILCPQYTTSPTATSQVSSCTIYATPVCRKELVLATNPLESIYYYSSFSYEMLDDGETTVELDSSLSVTSPTGEVQVVEIIHPLNTTTSTPPWLNDTIEAFRSCPPYGSGTGGDIITIIGRNFKDTQLNFCKFRACLSANLGQHPRRCKNQINAPTGESLPVVGNISEATYITRAKFISSTRMECTTPEFIFNDDDYFKPTFDSTNYECMFLDAYGNNATRGNGNFSYVRPCDTVPGTVCPNKPMVGFEFFSRLVFPCTVTESFLGICGDTPIDGYMMNPCMSGELTVEVTNDGTHYTGGDNLEGIFLVSTVRYFDNDVIYDNFKNTSINATLAVYTMVMPEYFYTNPDIMQMERAHCSLPLYMEEAPRLREQDIYMLKAMEVASIRIDLSFIPDFMIYGQHYIISIYVRPSRCDSNFCNSAGVQLPPEEFVPCQSPISYSNWFNQKDIPKNVVNNITLFALDDLLFQVQIHIPYGLFAAYRPLFYNTTSVKVSSPSRAKAVFGLDKSGVATRQLTPHVSFVRQTVPMQYFFCAVVYQDDSTYVYQPLNLPPRYSDYAEGRALLLNNVSYGNPKVPLVLDNYDDINFGVDFWMMPATTPSESKEQLDAYFETFHETVYDPATGYTFDFQTLVIPYFPYFSNCFGFDSYIPIWFVTENEDMCTLPVIYDEAWPRYKFAPLPPQDQILFVGPFDIFTDPIADWCEVTLQCNYEEQLTTTEATPRWFELESSETLFNLIRTPIDYFQYTGREGIAVSRSDGGGGKYVQELAAITTDNFIPVTIVRTTASSGCTLQCFPRTFTLEIQYYQFDAHNKRIITATLTESDFDRNTQKTDYELTINFRPLGFIDLILAFAFDTSIFVVLFILIGFLTVFVAFLGWVITRVTTLLQNPPQLRMTGMLALIVPPPMAGVTIAVVLIWLMTALANNFIYGAFVTDPNAPIQSVAGAQYIDQYPLLYNNLLTGTLTEDQVLSARAGRIGTAFMFIAFCCFAAAAKMYFPKEETKRELEIAQRRTSLAKKQDLWNPMLWKKLNFVFSSFVLGSLLVCAIYLSYWTDYDTYFYQVFVMYLLLGEFVAYVAERQLQDAILIAPLKCAYGFVSGLISFGSPNFLDFILSNYVEFAITSFQRVFQKFYLDGIGSMVSAISERSMQLLIRIVPKYLQGYSLFRQTEEAEKDYRKRAVEGIALQDEENESVEPILDYFGDVCCDTVITWYSPYVVYLLMQYRVPIYIPVAYGIRQSDMVIYMVYQLFLILFQPLVDIFNHSQNELFYGWKIYEYLVYSRYRFLQRETRWKGMENSLDECIEETLRRLDQMCFSSQYFLMLTVQFNGIIYVMLAYQIWIQNQYSPFSDPTVLFLGGYIFALFFVMRHGIMWLAIQLKVWRIKHENTAWHIVQEEEDELDIPAWEEIKGASTEAFLLNQRITSETFRYKFLNYNRTWLINQLPQLLTPRTLRRSRPYLINQFERIINAKRDDISDDSDGANEKKFGPVALTAPSRNIVRWWLGRARRRMRLRNFVEPLIKRARGAQCEQCLSRKQLQVEYEVDLDTMSSMYDKSYPGDEEVDQVQWKTFWTNNQRYHTICLACITKRKEVDAKRALAAGGYDPLYDDDEQEAYPEWGPVFLSAASKAIMLNWYKKAQKLRAGKRKQRVRKDKVVKDISDDEGDEPAFSWLKDGLKDITPASKAIAVKWMRTARARLQQKRGKGAGLRERDLMPEEEGVGEGFRSGMRSKMQKK